MRRSTLDEDSVPLVGADVSGASTDDEDDDHDSPAYNVYVYMDGCMLDVLRVSAAPCTSIEALRREICAAAWDLTGGAGPNALALEMDAADGCTIELRASDGADEDALLAAARDAPMLRATFENGFSAANRWSEYEWFESEMLKQEARARDLRARATASAAATGESPRAAPRFSGDSDADDSDDSDNEAAAAAAASAAQRRSQQQSEHERQQPRQWQQPPPVRTDAADAFPPPPTSGRAAEIERALSCGEDNLWGVLGLTSPSDNPNLIYIGGGQFMHDGDTFEAEPDAEAIRKAFLRTGKACHPDKHPDDAEAATEAQKLVNLAYAVLSDEDLRAVHERRMVQKRRERMRDRRRKWVDV